ncbi:PadR family transcriptional regulator [Rubrobacter indicoceani]|uniref:PadR family transcriptional regulator n=1 Tax=Rubrobacter indicoceani TaxID=2051957 RepID=UPI000E5C13DC|nr:PadR family transcriptional regulator [Rubrobacter indicoceani]
MKISTLGYAVLGLLAGGEMSGYDLKLRMAEPVGYFWEASHSQIYPELAKLEGAGMVFHEVVPQSGKPDRKVYGITASGLEAVGEWVTGPLRASPTRDETTLRAYLSWLGGEREMAGVFEGQARLHRERLAGYRRTERWILANCGGDPLTMEGRDFAGYAALRRGIGFEREFSEWCQWVSDTLGARAGARE